MSLLVVALCSRHYIQSEVPLYIDRIITCVGLKKKSARPMGIEHSHYTYINSLSSSYVNSLVFFVADRPVTPNVGARRELIDFTDLILGRIHSNGRPIPHSSHVTMLYNESILSGISIERFISSI